MALDYEEEKKRLLGQLKEHEGPQRSALDIATGIVGGRPSDQQVQMPSIGSSSDAGKMTPAPGSSVDPTGYLNQETPLMTPAPTKYTPATEVAMPVQSSGALNQNAVKAFNPTNWKNKEGKLQNNYYTNVAGDTGAGNADMKSGGIQMSGGVLPYVSDRSVSDYMSPDGTIQTKDFQSALGAAKTPAEKALVIASSKLAQAKSAASGGYDLTPGAFLAAKGDLANAEKEYQAAVAGIGSSGKAGENMALEAYKSQLGINRDALKFKAQSDRDDMKALTPKQVNTEEGIKAEIARFASEGNELESLKSQRKLAMMDSRNSEGKTVKDPVTSENKKEKSRVEILDSQIAKAENKKATADLLADVPQLALLRANVQKIKPEFQKMVADKNLRKEYDKDPRVAGLPFSQENFENWILMEKLAKEKPQHVADVMAMELGIKKR